MNPVEMLSGDDLIWLFSATSDAFRSVKDIHKKSNSCIDGEVFTHMRRAAQISASDAVKRLFYGKLKNYTHRLDGRTSQKDKELLVQMYDGIRRRAMSAEPSPLSGLEQALLAMQANAKKVEEVASDSARLRKGLEDVRVLLEDKQPLVKEEENE